MSLATDSGGFTPLHYGAQWDKRDTVLHLIQHLKRVNGDENRYKLEVRRSSLRGVRDKD